MKQQSYDKGIAIALFGLAFVGLNYISNILADLEVVTLNYYFQWFLLVGVIASFPIMAYGCFLMAKSKGYNGIIGVLLSILLIGPLIISFLPSRKSTG